MRLLLILAFAAFAAAQSVSLVNITSSVPIVISQTVSGSAAASTSFSLVTFVPTTPTPTPTSDPSASASATYNPYVLETKLDPAFGVLGALLILTGLPSAFLGHKNRWTSFFLIGFYTLALTCVVLILRFGVQDAIHPPSKSLRGAFVASSVVAGIIGGGIAVFFWQQTKYFIGAWGGFAFGLWIQCFRNGGVIRPFGLRWILYIGLAVVGFTICTIPRIHYHVLLGSTAIVGATATILGVDCFTTAGLKEFYIYNLGFRSLFPKYAYINFPVGQTMQIELGMIAAITLMGAAIQLRVYAILRQKLKEINLEQRKRDAIMEQRAATRFADVEADLADWEKEHGKFATPGLVKTDSQTLTPGTEGDPSNKGKGTQLPALDLGTGVEAGIPSEFVANEDPELKKQEDVLAEIQTNRKSIEVLKTDERTPTLSTTSRPSRLSFMTQDLNTEARDASAHPRPPRAQNPRQRVRSTDALSIATSRAETGLSIERPSSTPLRDAEWDEYLRERKLFVPPSGATAPIPTTPLEDIKKAPISPLPKAVAEAIAKRQYRENAYEVAGPSGYVEEPPHPGPSSDARHRRASDSSDDLPVAATIKRHRKTASGTIIPAILAPKKPAPAPEAPTVTRTFEELTERHKEKMRELQEPLSRAETELARLEQAKGRWLRSKEVEKTVMVKREAEKLAAKMKEEEKEREKAKKERSSERRSRRMSKDTPQTRALSADRLARVTSPETLSRRVSSTVKVQEWQRFQQQQQDMAMTAPVSPSRRGSRLESSSPGEFGTWRNSRTDDIVPFPRRESSGMRISRSGAPRDPPS